MNLRSKSHNAPDDRTVIVVFALLLYTLAWIVFDIVTKDIPLNKFLRPHVPNWALWLIALSVPVTAAIVALRAVPWRISKYFMLILPIQGAIFGLVGEKHPYLQGVVTILLYFEAYVILPEWNRRTKGEEESILNLK